MGQSISNLEPSLGKGRSTWASTSAEGRETSASRFATHRIQTLTLSHVSQLIEAHTGVYEESETEKRRRIERNKACRVGALH